MKASEIIRKAKQHLWNGKGVEPTNKEAFVCWAIGRITNNNVDDDVYFATARVHELIEKQIYPHGTVFDWLYYQCGVPMHEIKDTKRMQAYRLAWMDRLIADFEAKGD